MNAEELRAEVERLQEIVARNQRHENTISEYKMKETILRSVPKFTDGPSELFRNHEASIGTFTETRSEYVNQDSLKKTVLLESLRGWALLRIKEVSEISRAFGSGSYQEYLKAICRVFNPDSERSLMRTEFKQYSQKRTQDVGSYFQSKLMFFKLTFETSERSFETLRSQTIKGLANLE